MKNLGLFLIVATPVCAGLFIRNHSGVVAVAVILTLGFAAFGMGLKLAIDGKWK